MALNVLGNWKPDLILSDWNMPRMDGEALLQQLQTSAALGTVSIVVMSAPPTRGLAGVLEKPFSVRMMLDTIEEILGASR